MPPRPGIPSSKATAEQLVSPAAIQQRQNSSGISDYELPKTTLTKLAKGSIPDNVKMQQDVVQALLRSSTLFISYLAAAAHDQAIERSGKSITAGDVLKAMTELDFGPADALIPLLEQELAAYRANLAAAKASKTKNASGTAGGAGGKNRRQQYGVDESGDVDMGEDGGEGEDEGDGGGEEEDEGEDAEEEEEVGVAEEVDS